MTARPHYDPQAGPWVAWREWPRETSPGGRMRAYVRFTERPDQGYSWDTDPSRAARYDTKAEAEGAVAGPRVQGVRRGAERVA